MLHECFKFIFCKSNLEDLIEGVKPLLKKRQGRIKQEKENPQAEVQDLAKALDTHDELREARLKVFRAKKVRFFYIELFVILWAKDKWDEKI